MSLFGTPDDAFQTSRMSIVGFGGQTQITDRWQASVRVGLERSAGALRQSRRSAATDIFGVGFGDIVTITGANGYSVTGRGVLDFGPFDSREPIRAAGRLRADDLSGEPRT